MLEKVMDMHILTIKRPYAMPQLQKPMLFEMVAHNWQNTHYEHYLNVSDILGYADLIEQTKKIKQSCSRIEISLTSQKL